MKVASVFNSHVFKMSFEWSQKAWLERVLNMRCFYSTRTHFHNRKCFVRSLNIAQLSCHLSTQKMSRNWFESHYTVSFSQQLRAESSRLFFHAVPSRVNFDSGPSDSVFTQSWLISHRDESTQFPHLTKTTKFPHRANSFHIEPSRLSLYT